MLGISGRLGPVGALGVGAGALLPAVAHGTEVDVVSVAEEQVAGAHLTGRHGDTVSRPDSGM